MRKRKKIVLEYDVLDQLYSIRVNGCLKEVVTDRKQADNYFDMLVEYKGETKRILREATV